MRDASNPDEAVMARLRVVMTGSVVAGHDDQGVRDQPAPAATRPDAGWPPLDEMPLAPVAEPVADPSRVPPWEREVRRPDPAGAVRPDGAVPAAAPVPASTGLSGIGAFDPGRRGVKALAAVAVVVILVAAVLAWRSRPQVEPVPPVPVAEAADVPAAPDATNPTAGAGAEVVIAVAGKVRRPGLVRLPPGSRVADALQAAGGADKGVDVALLNLARKVVDGELILVGVAAPPGAEAATGGPAGAPAGGPVNLNTATLAELDTLPGVGPVLAQRILDKREQQGGFTAVSDLRKVDGIGSSRYEQLKDLVTV